MSASLADTAAVLHRDAVIIDGLNASAWNKRVFENLRAGGVTAINATTACWEDFRRTTENIAAWHRQFEQCAELIMPIQSAADLAKAKVRGRVGIILGFQNASPIEDDLDLLSVFHALGVRVIQLAFNGRSLVGDSCSEAGDGGLSNFGRDVVREMNRLGILIDLSHASDRATRETIELSEQPIAITHANPRALCDNPRNKPDDLIRAMAARGGVIGANIFPLFLRAGWQAKLTDFLDVIDYLVELIGIDHVGIGTDFTEDQTEEWFRWLVTNKNPRRAPIVKVRWPYTYPEGIRSCAEFPNITRGLLERGHDETAVKKIMGGNWLRLYGEVWKPRKWENT